MQNCPNCGRPVEDGMICSCQSTPVQNQNGGNSKKLLFTAIPVAILVVVVGIVAAILLGSGGHMTPINNYIKVLNSKTTDSMSLVSNLMPSYSKSFTTDMVKFLNENSDTYADSIEETNEMYEDSYDNISDEFDSWKISFEVKSEKEIKEKDLEDYADSIEDSLDDDLDALEDRLDDDDLIEDYADMYDMDEDDYTALLEKNIKFIESKFKDVKVTEGMKVKGKFIVKADDEEFETDTVTLLFIKLNGQWCYYGLDDGDYLSGFDTDDENAYLFSFLLSPLNSRSYYTGLTLY